MKVATIRIGSVIWGLSALLHDTPPSYISIIFYCFMPILYKFYILLATFIWFIGLTYWSSAQCQFLFFACFLYRGKSISNEVQMSWKFMVIFYAPEEAPEAKELGQKSHEASTRVEGAPYPSGTPSNLVGPSWTPLTCSRCQKFL